MKRMEKTRQGIPVRAHRLLWVFLIVICLAAETVTAASAFPVSSDTRGLADEFLQGFMSVVGDTRSISDANIEKIPDQVYTGRAITPVVRITFLGKRLRKGTDYTVKYTNNRSVGTAKCTITGKGKYKGTKTVSFKIVRQKSESSSSGTKGKTFKVTVSPGTYVYNGKYRKPSVKVTLGNKKIRSNYYTVKYSDNRNVGTALVTVTGKGDYSGCKGSAKFTITLKKTVIRSVKSSDEGELEVFWNQDGQADGYQVQYCTRKNFSANAKTRYIRENRTTSTEITGLDSGKKYYIRMRSYKKIGSKNSYSEWSSVKEKIVK